MTRFHSDSPADAALRVLVVIPSLARGGAERVVSRLSQEWDKRHSVQIALFDTSGRAYEHGGSIIDLALPSRGSGAVKQAANFIARVSHLTRLIRRERPDLILSFMESANFPTALAAVLAGTRDRLTVSVRNDPARFRLLYRMLMPLIYRLPRRVVGASQGVANALRAMGIPGDKLSAIPNPAPTASVVDTTEITPSMPPRFVLGVGRLHRQKGFDRLLAAFARIDDPSLHLVILGEGAQRAELEAQIRALDLSGRVLLPGSLADLSPWYRAASCFVLSSRHEGWPNVLMEAMASGCPVVSFDCPYGPSEVIQHGSSGLIVPGNDVDGLHRAMTRILTDTTLRLELGANGRRRAAEFDIERLAPRWLEAPRNE